MQKPTMHTHRGFLISMWQIGQRKGPYAVTEGKGHNAQEFRTSA